MEYIECLICNKKFKRISTTHLKHVHGITYEEYFKQFPGSKIETPDAVSRRKVTLQNMILKYGDVIGAEKWNAYCNKQAETNSFDYKQKKFGFTSEQFDIYNKSRGSSGNLNGNFQKGFYKVWVEKYGLDAANEKLEQFKQLQRENNTGRKVQFSKQALQNMRDGAIERMKRQGGLFISYNPKSISIIEEYGLKHDYEFQHAENGGEVQICGYFVDGYDKKNNVVIEYDEKHHFTKNGQLTQRDYIRQQNIIDTLQCKFIRISYTNEITIYEKNY